MIFLCVKKDRWDNKIRIGIVDVDEDDNSFDYVSLDLKAKEKFAQNCDEYRDICADDFDKERIDELQAEFDSEKNEKKKQKIHREILKLNNEMNYNVERQKTDFLKLIDVAQINSESIELNFEHTHSVRFERC